MTLFVNGLIWTYLSVSYKYSARLIFCLWLFARRQNAIWHQMDKLKNDLIEVVDGIWAGLKTLKLFGIQKLAAHSIPDLTSKDISAKDSVATTTAYEYQFGEGRRARMEQAYKERLSTYQDSDKEKVQTQKNQETQERL